MPNALPGNRLWTNHQIGEEEGCRPIKSHYPRHGLERGNKRHTRSEAGEAPCSLSAGAVPWGRSQLFPLSPVPHLSDPVASMVQQQPPCAPRSHPAAPGHTDGTHPLSSKIHPWGGFFQAEGHNLLKKKPPGRGALCPAPPPPISSPCWVASPKAAAPTHKKKAVNRQFDGSQRNLHSETLYLDA